MALAVTNSTRRAGAAITVAASVAIAFLTLRPSSGGAPPAATGGYLATDVILNVILFLPLGLGLALLGLRPKVAIALGCWASIAIELAQLWIVPGRFASAHDVLTNTLGTGLAVMAATHWATRAIWWRRLAPFAIAAVVAAWVGGSFLMRPALPRPGTMWSQWGHEFLGVQFTGRVLLFTLQGVPLPDGRLPNGNAVRALLERSDTIRLTTMLTSGPMTEYRLAQIVSMLGGDGEEYVGIWQREQSIQARLRLRTSDVWLRNPWVRLDDALPGAPGDTVRIEARATRGSIRLTASRSGEVLGNTVRLTPELFWAGFLPFEFAATSRNQWWPLVPALPTLVLLGLAAHRRVLLGMAALFTAILLGPLMAGISLPRWPVALAGALAVALGVRLGRRLGL